MGRKVRLQGTREFHTIESSSGQGRSFLDHIQGRSIKEVKRPLNRQSHLKGSWDPRGILKDKLRAQGVLWAKCLTRAAWSTADTLCLDAHHGATT